MKTSAAFRDARRSVEGDPQLKKAMLEGLAIFPIDCPLEYKEVLCAIGGSDVEELIREPLEILNGKSIRQLIDSRDFDTLEKYLSDFITIIIGGVGAI